MHDVTSSFVLTIDDKPNRNTGTGRELYSCIHGLSQLPRPTLDTVDGSEELLYAYTIGFAAILSLCNDRAFGARKLLAPITTFVHTLPTLPHATAAAVLLLLLYIYDTIVAMTSFIALCIVRFTQRHIRTDVTCDFNSI